MVDSRCCGLSFALELPPPQSVCCVGISPGFIQDMNNWKSCGI